MKNHRSGYVNRGGGFIPTAGKSWSCVFECLLVCGGVLLALAARAADGAFPAQAAVKAGVDEAALARQRRAAAALASANVEMRRPAKAAADEAALAAQLRAAEASALSNVEWRSQTKATVDESLVAAQLRAAQATAQSNVELSGQTKVGVAEAAVAAQLKAAEAAALSNVELGGQGKAAADAAVLPAAPRTGAQSPISTTIVPGLLSIGSAVKPRASNPSSVAPVAPFGPTFVSPTYQYQVNLPPLSAAQLDDLQKPDATPEKGRYQISVGRVFDPSMVVDSTTAPAAWTLLPSGWRVLLIDVGSEGALGLRVHLESLRLPDGARVVVYDPANPAPEATAINAQSLQGESEVWTESIFSSRVVVECQVPPGVNPATVSFRASELSHFFRSLFPEPRSGGPKAAGACENDVTCFPAWAGEATGVARILFISGGSGFLCTGCLLNTSPATYIDYFLTANHCVGDQAAASTLEAWWYYQTSVCDGTPPSLGSVPHTTGGADLLATQTRAAGNDFAFLRLRTPAPGGAHYAGWNITTPAPTDTLTTIHHPAADYKRISFGNTTGNDANYWFLRWYDGVTEHGSSGAPVYGPDHRVLGQLWGGDSDCANQSGLDEYGRFNVTWDAINYWLYPPENDVVGGAHVLPDSLSYSTQWTTNATDDTGLPCSGTIYKGIWFKYTPTVTGTGIVDTCQSAFDTKIQIYDSSMTSVGCNDDSAVCGGAPSSQSAFSFACTAGQTYFIGTGGNPATGAQGWLQIRAYSVCASATVPGNDSCADAWTLADGPLYTSGNTLCASDDSGLACADTIYRGVWYNYTPAVTGEATVDTCGSDFDTKIVIFSDNCGALNLIGCNDDSPACGSSRLQSSYSFPCAAGTTYRICAGGWGGYYGNLKIRAQAHCTVATLPNDSCGTATSLLDSLNYTTENTVCATDDTNPSCANFDPTYFKGGFFRN